jgi:ABC-type uncharacterized transport system substrate-binding protein
MIPPHMTHPFRILLALLVSLALSVPAFAHPHVWVTMTSEIVYAPGGAVTGVRHTWAFDDMYSVFATEGLEQKTKGAFTREELAPLAEVNIGSLKEFDFFTHAKIEGKKVSFNDPVDYWLDYKDEVLTLHFTLPFKSPVKAQNLELEIYDQTYFVDFAFAEKNPFALAGAPASCKFTVERPNETSAAAPQKLGESFFNQATSNNWGAQFANKVAVKCP